MVVMEERVRNKPGKMNMKIEGKREKANVHIVNQHIMQS